MIIKLYGHSAIERDHGRHLWPRWGACKRGRDNMATAWWRSARPSWVSDAPENIWWTFDERAADSDPVDRVSRVTRVTIVRERGVARCNNATWWTCGKCGSWWTRRKSDPGGILPLTLPPFPGRVSALLRSSRRAPRNRGPRAILVRDVGTSCAIRSVKMGKKNEKHHASMSRAIADPRRREGTKLERDDENRLGSTDHVARERTTVVFSDASLSSARRGRTSEEEGRDS